MMNIEHALQTDGYLLYTNKGVSMMPLLRQNHDVMHIVAQHSGFKVDDVVLFKRDNGQYVIHRITKIHEGGLYTIIGDNCIGGELVREDQLLGRLIKIHRDGTTLSVTDPRYLRYVKTVPFRRWLLRVKWRGRRLLSKPYHVYKRLIRKSI